MNIFSTLFSKPQPELVPAPDPPVDREAELLEQLHGVDGELALLNDEMRTFRTRNFGFIDGVVMVRGTDVSEATRLRERWDGYLRRLSTLQSKRSEILGLWSQSKRQG